MGIFSALFSHGLSNYRYEKRRRERADERDRRTRERDMAILARRTTATVTPARVNALNKAVDPELLAEAAKRGIKIAPSHTGDGDVFVEHPSVDSITGSEITIVPITAVTKWLEHAIPRIDREKGSESKAAQMHRIQTARYEEWRNAELAKFADMRAAIESQDLSPEETTKRLEALQRVEYFTLKSPPYRVMPGSL